MDRRKLTGTLGETAAVAYLTRHGVRILERNYRSRYGEIDLIGADGTGLIVVEVKARKGPDCGDPAEAVDYRKIRRICRTFNHYRMIHRLSDFTPVRFDVIEIDREFGCHWIKNAFEFVE